MTTGRPTNSDPSAMPGAGFEHIQAAILGEAQTMGIAESRTSIDQEYALLRVASQSVLEVLDDLGVEDAATLSKDLAETSEEDPLTDIFTVAADYEHDLSNPNHSPISRGHQQRLARLAYVTGKTAQTALATTMGSRTAFDSLRRARHELVEYERPATSIAGYALHAMLDKAEAVPLSA